MAKNIGKIKNQLFSATLGLDYDQPTSLESDLDLLADLLIKEGFCSKRFKPNAKSGYLNEVLAEIKDPDDRLASVLELCSGIDEILGNVAYGGLGKGEAEDLESLLEDFIYQFEDFLDGTI